VTKLSRVWPWRRFSIDCELSAGEATRRLSEVVGKRDTPFIGSRRGPRFKLRRNTRGESHRRDPANDPFFPLVVLTIEPQAFDTSRVDIRIRMRAHWMVFNGIWVAGVLAGGIAWAAAHGPRLPLLIPVLMLAGLVISSGTFAPEADTAEGELRKLFPPLERGRAYRATAPIAEEAQQRGRESDE
jgi:hypothetical protein